MDLKKMLNMDKQELENSVKMIEKMMDTPEGQKLKSQIMKMDRKDLLKGIENMQLNDNSKNEVIKELTSDPDLLKKLSTMLNKRQ